MIASVCPPTGAAASGSTTGKGKVGTRGGTNEAAASPELSFRELADGCCKSCAALSGDGPWCGYCGREMPGAVPEGDSWFALDTCGPCSGTLAAERVWWHALGGYHEVPTCASAVPL